MSDEKPLPFDPSSASVKRSAVEGLSVNSSADDRGGEGETPSGRGSNQNRRPNPSDRAIDPEQFERLMGKDLALIMQEQGYHPVMIFGTTNAGKTCLLLSLFAILETQAEKLRAGASLKASLFEDDSDASQELYSAAKKTFHILTKAFINREAIPATKSAYPFFIPIELKPRGVDAPPIRLAFMESAGEWYNSNRERGQGYGDLDVLYRPLKRSTEAFIANFGKGITFLYLAPYTQQRRSGVEEPAKEVFEMAKAREALEGVLAAYDAKRINGRQDDFHQVLVTKWDKRAEGKVDRAAYIEEDREELEKFFSLKYGAAWHKFDTIEASRGRKGLNAYCAGIMTEDGLLPVPADDEAADVINDYPIRLWARLYKNALISAGQDPLSPFPLPPEPNPFVKLVRRVLDAFSGS
jgi:hypothetical protein